MLACSVSMLMSKSPSLYPQDLSEVYPRFALREYGLSMACVKLSVIGISCAGSKWDLSQLVQQV